MLTPAELTQTVVAFIQALPETEGADPLVIRLKAALNEDVKILNKAITAVRVNVKVEDVAEADSFRDDQFLTFRDMVHGQRRKKEEAIQMAYSLIWPVIEKAGTRLHTLGYTEQSGKLSALFEELDMADKQEALETLKVADLYAGLKEAEQAFVEMFANKLSAEQALNYPTLKEAKTRLFPHITTLFGVLEFLGEEGDAYALSRVPGFNSIISAIMTTAKARKTRSESDEEKADDANEAPENIEE